jgi:hypothetical protein
MFVIFGYWAASKVFIDQVQISKFTKLKVGILVPLSMLFPLAMINLIDMYAILLYLVTIPLAVFLINKLSGNEYFNLSGSFAIYKAVAGRVLFFIIILAAISRLIMFVIKN